MCCKEVYVKKNIQYIYIYNFVKYFFRYQFNADNEGTHFWHAHTGLQKLDGIFGSLTIRQSAKRDVNSYLYDFDLSRHNIVISDWMHELALSRSPGRLHDKKFQFPDSFLFNGKGRYKVTFILSLLHV